MNLIESKATQVEARGRRGDRSPLGGQAAVQILSPGSWQMMNFFFLSLAFSAQVASSPILLAQAAVPGASSAQSSPSPSIPPSGPADQSGVPRLPSVEQLDEMFRQAPLGKTADEALLHAQWRELGNRTVNETDLVAARARAEAATTDLEKRQRLRVYYTTYYDRMRARAVSPDLKDFIDARKAEKLALLAQDRVRPGASPATAKQSPTPSAKGKRKKYRPAPEPALPQ